MNNRQNTLPMIACLAAGILTGATDRLSAANPALPLLNEPVDVSGDFRDFSNLYYLADKLADFDPATGSGKITINAPNISRGRRSTTCWRSSSRSV
jgi:hypothetical protein